MPPKTAKSKKKPKSVRVWQEIGLTINVTEDPPQFVRITFGHERISPDDSEASLKQTERKIHDFNEEILEKRVEQLLREMKRVTSGKGSSRTRRTSSRRVLEV